VWEGRSLPAVVRLSTSRKSLGLSLSGKKMAGAGIEWGSIVFHSCGQIVHPCGSTCHSYGQNRLHGVERANPVSRKAARSAIVEHFLQALEVIDYDLAVARTHATLWAGLAKAGSLIGPYDMLIAASALTHGHKLATLNESEFKHVTKLKLVDVRSYMKADS
jgi:predicted nucleic acid-binding protein